MTWPASDVSTTNTDAGGDSAALARSDLLDLMQKFNQLRVHVSAFAQTLLTRTDAAGLRSDAGLANHHLVTVDASGNLSTAGTIQGSNVSMTSDERLKQDWSPLAPEFVERLARVKAGTFEFKRTPGRRHAGVSAQDLQALLPEAVMASPDDTLSVAYGQAALVACIALAREVQDLRQQVLQLKGQP